MRRNCYDCPSDELKAARLRRVKLELPGLTEASRRSGKTLMVAALFHYLMTILAGNGIIRAKTWRGGGLL